MGFTSSTGEVSPSISGSSSSQILSPASLTFALPTRRVAFAPPFASVTISPLFGTARAEPATNILFPADVCVLTTKNCPQLMGLG